LQHPNNIANLFPGGEEYTFGMNDHNGWNQRDAMNPAVIHFLQDPVLYQTCVFLLTKLNKHKKNYLHLDFSKVTMSFYGSVCIDSKTIITNTTID
jgi:hypothetical protein